MRKKHLFMLPCMAVVAVAAAFGTKSLQTNASNSLLMENVEALSAGEQDNGTTCGGNGYKQYYEEKPYGWFSSKQNFIYCTSGCPPKSGYSPSGPC